MGRGLGKVQRRILEIIEESDLRENEWLTIEYIRIQMDAEVEVHPQSKSQTIWRAIRRLEKLGYVETTDSRRMRPLHGERRHHDCRSRFVR